MYIALHSLMLYAHHIRGDSLTLHHLQHLQMYVCMYVCTYVCMHACMYHTYVCMICRICLYAWNTRMYVCMYVYMYSIWWDIGYACICVSMYVRKHISCTYMYVYTRTYIHTCMYNYDDSFTQFTWSWNPQETSLHSSTNTQVTQNANAPAARGKPIIYSRVPQHFSRQYSKEHCTCTGWEARRLGSFRWLFSAPLKTRGHHVEEATLRSHLGMC
jgi:hypothetical protein